MIKNIFCHLRKIIIHRFWVRHYCFKAQLYWRGLIHDLSKYSPIEFWESVRYYCGASSPIDACKKDKGYSMAWFHHRGHNKHHWEYWVDNFQDGMTPVLMPAKYAIEMFCDFLGAGRAYGGKAFSFANEYDWWREKRSKVIMHPRIKAFIDDCFWMIECYGVSYLFKRIWDLYYEEIENAVDQLPPGTDSCVVCGKYVPEGRQVCELCERRIVGE